MTLINNVNRQWCRATRLYVYILNELQENNIDIVYPILLITLVNSCKFDRCTYYKIVVNLKIKVSNARVNVDVNHAY